MEKYHKKVGIVQDKSEEEIRYLIDIILEEHLRKEQTIKNRNLLILSIVGTFTLSFSALYYRYKAVRKRKRKIIDEKEDLIRTKEKIIREKDQHTKQLEQKIKAPLDEVIESARKNNPNFYTKFQDQFPSFHSKLLNINPELSIGELTLLAYIFLNFSSKEIADFTFRSYRTIQTRKYHLRKKLKLKKNTDFYVWLKEICK